MPDGGQVTMAMARGLDVLRAFAADDEWLGNQELAARTGLPRPTVTRATNTLVEAGFLQPDAVSQKFCLGPAVLVLAGRVTRFAALRSLIRPVMAELARESGASIGAVHVEGGELVYFEYCRSQGPVALSLAVGSRGAVLHSAAGSALLGAATPAERRQLIEEAGQGRGIAAQLREQARRGAAELGETGHCRSFGLWHPEVNSIAVPWRLPVTGLLVAFTAAGPAYAMPPERLETQVAPRLRAAVDTLRRSFEP